MSARMMWGVFVAFALLTLMNGLIEMDFYQGSDQAVFEKLIRGFSLNPANWLAAAPALWECLWWSYGMFNTYNPDGTFNYISLFRFCILLPLSAAVLIILIPQIIAAISSVTSSIGSILGFRIK